MSKLLQYSKIKITISQKHLENWKTEVGFYTTPCVSIISSLTTEFLNGKDTICVGNDESLEVSVVLMGYSTKRIPNYESILKVYLNMKMIKTIVLIWNNKHDNFSSKYDLSKITFVYPDDNSMNNRFNVSQYITTDAVLLIDDDVVMSEPLLRHMLLGWTKNVNRLVGVDSDMRFVSAKNEYKIEGRRAVIAIGKTMLLHRKYLQQYMNDKQLVKWNKGRFCEDISMNGLITNITGLKPLFVKQTATRNRQNLPEIDGLSITRTGWLLRRTECVRFVSNHFNIHF